jgi:hypothetical protein
MACHCHHQEVAAASWMNRRKKDIMGARRCCLLLGPAHADILIKGLSAFFRAALRLLATTSPALVSDGLSAFSLRSVVMMQRSAEAHRHRSSQVPMGDNKVNLPAPCRRGRGRPSLRTRQTAGPRKFKE